MRGARSRGERYPKLKPGPGRSAPDVAAHQRGRLQGALVELVAEGGYRDVTVATLTERAAVSKRDFYKLFAGKEECFLRTYDAIVHGSLQGILAAIEGEEESRERLRLGFRAFADQVAGRPEAARLALVDVLGVGEPAAERVLRAVRLFEALLAETLSPEGGRLPQLVVKGIVGGGSRVARARLLAGRPRALALDSGEFVDWALSLRDEDAARLRGLAVAPMPVAPAAFPVAVPGEEKALILAATAKLAAEEGYAGLTVPRVRAAAGLPRSSFDAHFEGVPDCYLATLSMLSGRTLAAAAPAFLAAGDWARGVHRMTVALCHLLARDPGFARLVFLEACPPGVEAIRWRAELIARLARTLRRRAEPGRQPSEVAAEASVGAMWAVMRHLVAAGHVGSLPAAAPVLSYLALCPALGATAAIDLIVAESRALQSPANAAPAQR